MTLTWGAPLLLSIAFRFWGYQHPDPFSLRPLLIVLLLLGPTVLIGFWILQKGFSKTEVDTFDVS